MPATPRTPASRRPLPHPRPSPQAAPALLLAALLALSGCAGLMPGGAANAPAASAGPVETPAHQALRQALADALEGVSVSVLLMPDGQLQLNVPSDFSFTPDKAVIRAEGRPALDKIAAQLQAAAYLSMRVRVVGHTDSQGSASINDALSLARANSVRHYLETKGVAASRLSAVGLGAREPVANNDKPYGRTLNRRVEIYLQEAGGV